MAVKCSGAEYKAFIDAGWGDIDADWGCGYYMDDYEVSVNGTVYDQYGMDVESAIKPTDKVVIICGDIYRGDSYIRSLESHFKAWRKSQTTAFLLVECPVGAVDAVKTAIILSGGKVN